MNKEEFTRCVLEAESSLYRVAKSISINESDCEDAVQEAILTAYEKLGTLKEEKFFKTWLTRILINICFRMAKKRKNVIFAECISSLVCMILVMLIFTPVYLYILKTNDNMIVTFGIFILAIIISQIVSYKLLQKEYYSKLEELGIILFVIFFLINIIFTYYPPKVALFYDYTNKIYGLK